MDNINEAVAVLAAQVIAQLELRTRQDGSVYWALADGSPEWMKGLCYKAHGELLPDDYRYRYIVEALWLLAQGDTEGEDIQVDTITADLTAWLNSSSNRQAYCDLAVEDGFGFENTRSLLMNGQLMEKLEVLALVRSILEDQIGEIGEV